MSDEQTSVDPQDITPDFLNKEEETLFALAQKGVVADSFLNSGIGRMAIEACQNEVNEISQQLLSASAEDVVELQTKARIAIWGLERLRDTIAAGEIAHNRPKESRADDQ